MDLSYTLVVCLWNGVATWQQGHSNKHSNRYRRGEEEEEERRGGERRTRGERGGGYNIGEEWM